MNQTHHRRRFTAEQKADLWRLWKSGQSLSDIGRALGKHAGSIHTVLSAHGGIAPATRSRSPWALSLAEREEISRGLAAGESIRQMAARLQRPPSTLSREIAHNGGCKGYRAVEAEANAWNRAQRPKPCRLQTQPPLQAEVAGKLGLGWSPEQIAGWLKREYPDGHPMRISHETLYKSLFIQARGVLKKELAAHLRTGRMMRRSRSATSQPRGQIIDAVSIRQRPPEAEDRAVPGHWEGDLISGSGNSHIATLVERQSRFVMLVRVEGKDTVSVVDALIRQVGQLPAGLMASLTWDRGMELAQHKRFAVATEVAVYFCDPRSPTKTPTAYCGSIYPRAPIWAATPSNISMKSP